MNKKWEEYKFKILSYTPDTLPMARCANYLAELATMLGEEHSVHFVKVAPGSAQLIHKIDCDAVNKVSDRITAVSMGEGTVKEMRAFRQINRMLHEDGGTGVLVKGRANVLQFPGKEDEGIKLASIHQYGEINGRIIRIGGSKEIVPIMLEVEGKEISGCHADRTIAKPLAKHIFETVRLYGEGRWERSSDGEWSLINFSIDRFEALEEKALSAEVADLRKLTGNWGEDALQEVLESRHYEEGMH